MPLFTQEELEEMRKFDESLGGEDDDLELTPEEVISSKYRDTEVIVTRYMENKLPTDRISVKRMNDEVRKYQRKKESKPISPEAIQHKRDMQKSWEKDHYDERRVYRQKWYQSHKEEIRKKHGVKKPQASRVDLDTELMKRFEKPETPNPLEEIANGGKFKPIMLNTTVLNYMISTRGVVVGPHGILDHYLDNRGFHCVRLCTAPDIRHSYQIHRLMAEAFLPNPTNSKWVDFRNGDKNDLRVENLVWCKTKPSRWAEGYDWTLIKQICAWIQQGVNLRTISCVTGLSYMYITAIAEGKVQKQIAVEYHFPQPPNY